MKNKYYLEKHNGAFGVGVSLNSYIWRNRYVTIEENQK